MKKSYDIVGAGDAISGLVACILLGAKGFSALWVDTATPSGQASFQDGIIGTVTADFFEKCFKPIFRPIDLDLAEHIFPHVANGIQSVIPGERVDLRSSEFCSDQARLAEHSQKYLASVTAAMRKPWQQFRVEAVAAPAMGGWQNNALSGFSRSLKAGRLSYLRMMTAMRGLYLLPYGRFKDALGEALASGRGDYVRFGGTKPGAGDIQAGGLKFGDHLVKGRYYLSEDLTSARPGCRSLYLIYEVDADVIPVGMADMVVLSPPEGLDAPVTLYVSHDGSRAVISAVTMVREYDHNRRAEYAATLRQRIAAVVPFMDRHEVLVRQAGSGDDDCPRNWFSCCDRVRAPGILGRRKFVNPRENVIACDRRKDAGLDLDGEILWGVCIANTILSDLNRSDLFGCSC